MGLCKCRVVTTLFCFQCRVNVCETCMVKDHKTCIVRTYLQWLQDSDFDPACRLCGELLANGAETIRLPCLDVFHFQCLNRYAQSMPSHTAPAGYKCITCTAPIVPDPRNAGAVSVLARKLLSKVKWSGLTPPSTSQITFPDQDEFPGFGNVAPLPTATVASNGAALGGPLEAAALPAAAASSVGSPSGLRSTARKLAVEETAVLVPGADPDDNKYARRPVTERISRAIKNHLSSTAHGDDDNSGQLKRTAIIILVLIIVAITLLELATRLRPTGTNDELLDPNLNPNIRQASQ